MSHLAQLPALANHLDSMGLHREADILDSVLKKHAGALAYKEKPFLSRIAKILMILEKTEPGNVVKAADMVFPLSKTPLTGLTRQKGLEKVQAELEAFVQWLTANLQHRYKGTKFENSYRDFIEEVAALSRTISTIFLSSTEKQSITEAIKAVNKTRQMLGRLIVYARSAHEEDSTFEKLAELLLNLERAIQERNGDLVNRTLRDFEQSIPKNTSENAELFQAMTEAYEKGDIPFVGVQALDREVKDDPEEYGLAPEIVIERHDLASYEKDRRDRKETAGKLVERVHHLENRWSELQYNIQSAGQRVEEQLSETDIEDVTEPVRQYMKKPTPPPWNLTPRDWSKYRSIFRKYEFVLEDVDLLSMAYEMWSNTAWNQSYDFPTFLNAGQPGGQEALTVFMQNITQQLEFIYQEARWKYERLEKEEVEAREQRKEKDIEYDRATDRVLWRMWHREYVEKLIQMVRYSLAPETRGEVSTQQAFDKTLREFHKLLNYRL